MNISEEDRIHSSSIVVQMFESTNSEMQFDESEIQLFKLLLDLMTPSVLE